MGLVERTLDSGLVLSEYGQGYASLERELRKRDPLLSLQGHLSPTDGRIFWKVMRYAGPDRPFETIYVWQSESGEPYPLSSGILDGLDRHDRNTRSRYVSEDEINAAREREISKQKERDREAIVDDHVFRHGRPVLPRSQSLRMARDKRRNRGEKV